MMEDIYYLMFDNASLVRHTCHRVCQQLKQFKTFSDDGVNLFTCDNTAIRYL